MKTVLFFLIIMIGFAYAKAQTDKGNCVPNVRRDSVYRLCNEKKEVPERKYASWYMCIVIAKGDTLRGKVKPKYEYYGKGTFKVAFNNGKKRLLLPRHISELWILNSHDTIKYLSIYTDGKTGTGVEETELFRVIIDGRCRLLYTEGLRLVASIGGGALKGAHLATIYYKKQTWEVEASPENFMIETSDFKKLEGMIFSDCPSFFPQLDLKSKQRPDHSPNGQISLKEIVTEFNKCIDESQAKAKE